MVTAARGAVLRLLAPPLGELLAQLERDRHRERAEIAALRERVERLEGQAATGDRRGGGEGPAAG
ncbi:MAG TPA: hypothetical protein VNT51_07960 [Miltoncostaeaceae bacterium]|nr:hypothetical protein [Miltoncostaeaceae bacterium]